MIQEGREVRPRTDYILGTDRRLFGNVSVRDTRHNSDHYMVLGCLHSAHLRENARYLGGCKRLPLRPPTDPTREDGLFTAIWRDVPKPLAREARKTRGSWRQCGDSSTRDSPRSKISQSIRLSFGGWDAPLRQACGLTGNGGQRRQERRWKN